MYTLVCGCYLNEVEVLQDTPKSTVDSRIFSTSVFPSHAHISATCNIKYSYTIPILYYTLKVFPFCFTKCYVQVLYSIIMSLNKT